jgi:hypothetical protein
VLHFLVFLLAAWLRVIRSVSQLPITLTLLNAAVLFDGIGQDRIVLFIPDTDNCFRFLQLVRASVFANGLKNLIDVVDAAIENIGY